MGLFVDLYERVTGKCWHDGRKREPIKQEVAACQHDWETIESSKEYWRYHDCFSGARGQWLEGDGPSYIFEQWQRARRRVCVKCGECKDEIAEAKKETRARKREVRRRKAWAKQLWEDGCKGGNSVQP